MIPNRSQPASINVCIMRLLIALFLAFVAWGTQGPLLHGGRNGTGTIFGIVIITAGAYFAANPKIPGIVYLSYGLIAGSFLASDAIPQRMALSFVGVGTGPLVAALLPYLLGVLTIAGFARAIPVYVQYDARKDARLKNDRCEKCGYLLHGLTEPRCPECSTPFENLTDESTDESKI